VLAKLGEPFCAGKAWGPFCAGNAGGLFVLAKLGGLFVLAKLNSLRHQQRLLSRYLMRSKPHEQIAGMWLVEVLHASHWCSLNLGHLLAVFSRCILGAHR
jgi:hypothetical protein